MSRTALPIGLLAPGIGARRNLVLLIATFGLIGSSSYAGAQPHKPAKIGLLFGGTLASRPQIDGFFQGLRDLGYVDGKNVSIEVRESLGQAERLPQQALELVALQPDVLVASSTPAALAAQKATRSIPVVMTLVSNAVELGLARSLAHPGGNITGVSVNTVELSRKRVQFAKELMPSASGIALLSNSQNKANASMVDEVKAAAKALKLNVRLIEFVGQGDLSTVLSKPVREPLLLLMNDPVIFDRRETVARFAIANRIATLATYPDEADAGALASYGPDIRDVYKKAATYVDKVLRGWKPADIPIEDPTRYEFVVNLKTAKALGVRVPNALMARADRVIVD